MKQHARYQSVSLFCCKVISFRRNAIIISLCTGIFGLDVYDLLV